MCSRFEYLPCDEQLSAVEQTLGCDVRQELSRYPANRDVRPTQPIPIIRWMSGEYPRVISACWGFVPPRGSTDESEPTFNVDIEHIDSHAIWRYAWRSARCLIPATGWYEPTPTATRGTGAHTTDQPLCLASTRALPRSVADASGQIMMLAGLHGFFSTELGCREIVSILTCPAPSDVDWPQPRMPCVVASKAWKKWLYPYATEPCRVDALLLHEDTWIETRLVTQRIKIYALENNLCQKCT